MAKTPGDIARELGLKFAETKLDREGKWLSFKFEFPDYDKVAVENTVAFRGVPKDYQAPASFLATVEAVKRWRERVKPWMLLGASDAVASELSLWSRAQVFKFNRANRKKIKAANEKLQKSEAYARQLAMTQQSPMAAIKVLDELTKCEEMETQALKMQLQNAVRMAEARIAEADAHADGKCSCAAGELCPVGVFERDAAADAKSSVPIVDRSREGRTATHCPKHADGQHRVHHLADGGTGEGCVCGEHFPDMAPVIPLKRASA